MFLTVLRSYRNLKNPTAPIRAYTYSHNDTITALVFFPANPKSKQDNPNSHPQLLSASTDGLVTLFDTSQEDEDDAVMTVSNNRSAVHHVSALPGQTGVLAVSHDEKLAFLPVADDNSAAEPLHHSAGGADGWDLKQQLGADYAICLRPLSSNMGGDGDAVLCVGANKP